MNKVEENAGRVDCFITSATGLMKLRQLKDNTGNFIFSQNQGVNALQMVVDAPYGSDPTKYGPVGTLMGNIPLYVSTQIAKVATLSGGHVSALTGGAATILFAGEAQYAAIAQRQQIEIAASNVAGNSFQFNQTWFRAILREDFALTQAGTWALLGFN
jgi:HK97 family phage major capsid protein